MVPASSKKPSKFVAKWLANLSGRWYALQLAHFGGKYSIERMMALEEYTRTASLLRVLCITGSLPLILVAVVICQESIPLQDPASDWKVQYGLWIRVAVMGIAVACTLAGRIKVWLDVPPLSTRQLFLYCFYVGIGFVSTGMTAAAFWTFPVPFLMLSLSLATTTIIVGLLRVAVGAQAFELILSKRDDAKKLMKIAGLHGLMTVVYPAYEILFIKTNRSNYEIPLLLFLPVFKLVMKVVFAKLAVHKEDLVPSEVVFTVDFFDALYLATFMPSLSSRTLAMVIIVDISQTAIELQELNQRTKHIRARLQDVNGTTNGKTDFLATLRSLCSNLVAHKVSIGASIRVRSCSPSLLSPDGTSLLEGLAKLQTTDRQSFPGRGPCGRNGINLGGREKPRQNRVAAQPLSLAAVVPLLQPNKQITHANVMQGPSIPDQVEVLHESLEVLFTSECLILTEYVEIAVPVIHGLFILSMVHFSSAQYHAEMVGVTLDNVGSIVQNMFLYALLEFASCIALMILMRRNCGIHMLYQLAFVLETEKMFVSSALVLWLLTTLTYRVVHFGTVEK